MNSIPQPGALIRAKTIPAAFWVAFLAVYLLFTSQSLANDPPAPKTVIVAPEGDVEVPHESTTFGFEGTAYAVDSSLAAVEWRRNGGDWQAATNTELWSFTATGLEVGANLVEVRSRNIEGTNSPIVSRTITRKPYFGVTCEEAAEIIEDGTYEYDLNFTGEAWFRFAAPEAGIVSIQTSSPHWICVSMQGDCSDLGGRRKRDLRQSTLPTRMLVYSGQSILLFVRSESVQPKVGSFHFTFESAEVESQADCESAREINGDGAYHFDMSNPSWVMTNPCRRPVDFKPFDYETVWYRFTAPEDGQYFFSLRQQVGSPPSYAGAEYWVNVVEAHFDIFTDEPCPLSCSARLMTLPSRTSNVFRVTEGSTYYLAVTNYHRDPYPSNNVYPGYGILDVEFAPITPGQDCEEAIAIADNGLYEFSNVQAFNEDPCRPDSQTQWFTYTASADGSVLVETCGLADFDTFLSAFEGECPLVCDDRITWNDDAVGPCGLQSRIEFAVQEGQTYKIAVSGFGTAKGSGQLAFEFIPASASVIVGDIVGNGIINVVDVTMLARMVVNGAPPPTEVGDINSDGEVNELDVHALARMIVD